MSRSKSLRGGEKKTIEIDAEDEKNIRLLETMLSKLRKKKISMPEYESPLDKMNARPLPTKDNTITIQGRCPAPFKGCDAIAAQKAGKMCPDPRYAVYPYIQEEDTGALCYPNLDAAKIQREINDEKKAAARHSVMQLIKVLAAFNDGDAAPEMCDVINKMSSEGNSRKIKQLYCTNLSKNGEDLCDFDTDGKGTCSRKTVGPSLSLVLPPKPIISADASSVEDKEKKVKKFATWIRSAARIIRDILNEIKNSTEKEEYLKDVNKLQENATRMENESLKNQDLILGDAEDIMNNIVRLYEAAQVIVKNEKAAAEASAKRRAAEAAAAEAAAAEAAEAERRQASLDRRRAAAAAAAASAPASASASTGDGSSPGAAPSALPTPAAPTTGTGSFTSEFKFGKIIETFSFSTNEKKNSFDRSDYVKTLKSEAKTNSAEYIPKLRKVEKWINNNAVFKEADLIIFIESDAAAPSTGDAGAVPSAAGAIRTSTGTGGDGAGAAGDGDESDEEPDDAFTSLAEAKLPTKKD